MKQYKIVKLPKYNFLYEVYALCATGWRTVGCISSAEGTEEELIKLAKELVVPQTLYFNA